MELLEKVDAVSSTLGTDGMPHGSGIARRTENLAVKLADTAKAYVEAEENALAIKEEVEDMINSIPTGIKGVVLYERYINLTKWEDVAELLHYSLPGIYRIHSQALEIVEKKLEGHE